MVFDESCAQAGKCLGVKGMGSPGDDTDIEKDANTENDAIAQMQRKTHFFQQKIINFTVRSRYAGSSSSSVEL